MTEDAIETFLQDTRGYLRAGVDHFGIPAAVMADLLHQSDSLADLNRHAVAYGLNTVLNQLQHPLRELALLAQLGARETVPGTYELVLPDYIACLVLQGRTWSWYTKRLDGQVEEAPVLLLGNETRD